MKILNLKSTEVLKKKFETELSGYNASEVDAFLDLILEDYVTYEETIKTKDSIVLDATKTAADRLDTVNQLRLEIENLKEQMSELSKTTEVELYDRVQQIEKQMSKKQK